MQQIINEGVTRYTHGDFIITIIENPVEFEAWIQNKKCGLNMLMFSSPKEQTTLNGYSYQLSYKGFCKIVCSNIPKYAQLYEEEYDTD